MSTRSEARLPSGTQEDLVDWDGPGDPNNPRNWSSGKKWRHAILVGVIILNVNLAAAMFAPGAPDLMKDMHIISSTVGTLTVSIYVLGFALGPLILSPLSELYGRLIIYQCCNFVYFCFTLGCALSKNTAMFLIFRFIAGCAGSAPMTIGGGTVADMFPQEQRGKVMGLLGLGPMLGPVAGPIAGGFVAQNIGWRWTFWIILIISGITNALAIILMRETYAPVLLARKTARLRKTTNNPNLRSKLDRGIQAKHLIIQSVIRPIKLLIFSPIVLLLSLYVAYTMGLAFLLFTTFPIVYSETYHFSTGIAGLTYLGFGLGLLLGVTIFATLSDKILLARARKKTTADETTATPSGSEEGKGAADTAAPTGPKFKPELRLFLMALLTPILPFGFFWYGWSADQHTHWIVPILGTGLIGVGSLFVIMPAQTYLVDVFGAAGAASALAALNMLRSLAGAFLPLAGPPLYDDLGLGWGNSVLGFIGLAFIPVPLLFYRYGENIRTRWPVKL